ncbi:SLAP domain-containing protein [Schleiferilactobacillus shenzhenensis]|nr:SLAP domain-containing protein [Schleiferilactobacillus shenzhenensis]
MQKVKALGILSAALLAAAPLTMAAASPAQAASTQQSQSVQHEQQNNAGQKQSKPTQQQNADAKKQAQPKQQPAAAQPAKQASSTSTVTAATGTLTVTNKNGAGVYASATGTGAERTLPYNSSWVYFAVAKNADGTTSYKVGTNEWVKAADVSVAGSTAAKPAASASSHPIFKVGSQAAPLVDANGKQVKQLTAGSRWQTFGTKQIDGATYYNVGGGQYVRADLGQANAN